jgi:hypothetical protein
MKITFHLHAKPRIRMRESLTVIQKSRFLTYLYLKSGIPVTAEINRPTITNLSSRLTDNFP